MWITDSADSRKSRAPDPLCHADISGTLSLTNGFVHKREVPSNPACHENFSLGRFEEQVLGSALRKLFL